jgi:hypothetical protein
MILLSFSVLYLSACFACGLSSFYLGAHAARVRGFA